MTPGKGEMTRLAIGEHIAGMLALMVALRKLAQEDTNQDFKVRYMPHLNDAEEALQKALDGVQESLVVAGMNREQLSRHRSRSQRKELHDLVCEVCTREFKASNPNQRTCKNPCLVRDI